MHCICIMGVGCLAVGDVLFQLPIKKALYDIFERLHDAAPLILLYSNKEDLDSIATYLRGKAVVSFSNHIGSACLAQGVRRRPEHLTIRVFLLKG